MPSYSYPPVAAQVDHTRLVEDLLSYEDQISRFKGTGLLVLPPGGALAQYGDDFLHAQPGDVGARSLQSDKATITRLSGLPYSFAFGGYFTLSWFHAASVLGRRDLAPRFISKDLCLDADAASAWLLMKGIEEHRLDRFLTPLMRRQICFGVGSAGDRPYPSPLAWALRSYSRAYAQRAPLILRFFGAKTLNALAIRVGVDTFQLKYVADYINEQQTRMSHG